MPVGHDTAIEANSIDDWLETIARRVRGTCETGAVEAWPILRRAIPDCRIAIIRRSVEDVAASLSACGIPALMDDLRRRHAALYELEEQWPGVLSLGVGTLADPRGCAWLQEHCLGTPFDWPCWLALERRNVQVDLPVRMARLAERRPAIDALKAEMAERLARPLPFVSVGEERWADVADDIERLGATHYQEATEGEEGPFKLDRATLTKMADAGLWRAFVARVDGVFSGYCCWTHEINAEAQAQPTMEHGPFYVVPAAKEHRLGMQLLKVSREVLAANGYKVLRLHHTLRGRGARAGALYQALGAFEYQREYVWRIGVADA
jgi:hypothetical protein